MNVPYARRGAFGRELRGPALAVGAGPPEFTESRRQFLLATGALALSGCATPCPPPNLPSGDARTALIDGHCHLFNAKDLSTVRFLSYVVAKHYPKRADLKPRGVEDPDWVDLFFEVVLAVVGMDAAPSARTELAVLARRQLTIGRHDTDVEPQDPAAAHAEMRQRVADFLGGKSFLKRRLSPGDLKAEADLRELIYRTAGENRELSGRGTLAISGAERLAIVDKALSMDAPKPTARNPALQDVYIPGLFDFVTQLKRFRHCIVDQLTQLHRDSSHQDPLLLVPAMVDFGRWLRDDPDKGSTFVDQAEVWCAIARRPGGPAVHGYVAFCPLRQVQSEMGRFGSGENQIHTACNVKPLDFVEDALRHKGFIGVKVYPPMGFRAARNAERGPGNHPFPEAVLADVYGHAPQTEAEKFSMSRDLGEKLDKAMLALFHKCREIGATVMAHGGNSVGANCDTGELADPYYWRRIFDLDGAPPVMLAHFGKFAYWSADPDAPGHAPAPPGTCQTRQGDPPIENTWEAWLARYIQQNPDRPVFADVSYFNDALANGTEQQARANFLKLEGMGLTAFKDHLVFGTDWVMLAQEKNAQVYSERVRQFISDTFGEDYVNKIMRTNFLRYASLSRDSATFQRISSVYQGDVHLIARLTKTCA